MKQVAVGIIMRDGLVLACQRRRDASNSLKWEFPGGKLENGESPESAVVRELREELGIDALIDREFCRHEYVYPGADSHSDGAFRVFYYLVHTFTGTPVNHAFEQIRWVTPVELKDMDILEGNRKAVEMLVSHESEKHVQKLTKT